jgi:DNA polymerase V
MNLLPVKLNSPSCHPLPFYETSVSAGFPSPALDYAQRALDLNEHLIPNPISTFFMRASSDALKESGILTDDLLIVDRSLKPQSGNVIVAVISGEFCLRRFEKYDKKITLRTDTSYAESFFLSADDSVQVWGVVTAVIHTL